MSRDFPSPVKLAHVVLRTPRFEAMLRWYETVLGARVVFSNPLIAFLTYDDEHHRLALFHDPGAERPGPRATGMDHFAFTYASLGQLVATWERLHAAGIDPYWCINHGPTTSLYYADPDGNHVELQIDNFPDAAALDAWFQTAAFAKNPIGVVFDPAALAERYHAGVPERELVLQGAVPAPGAAS